MKMLEDNDVDDMKAAAFVSGAMTIAGARQLRGGMTGDLTDMRYVVPYIGTVRIRVELVQSS